MNPICLLQFAVVVLFLSISAVADEHWYRVTVQTGSRSETFTGTSENDASRMENIILTGSEMVTLKRLSEFGIFNGVSPTWQEDLTTKTIRISPRAILYFTELAGDPLAKAVKPETDH